MVSRSQGTKIYVPPDPIAEKVSTVPRADLRFMVGEAIEAEKALRGGNRDRYIIGRRSAFMSVICRLLRVSRGDLDRYIDYAHGEVVRGERLMNIEEPQVWIRKNPV